MRKRVIVVGVLAVVGAVLALLLRRDDVPDLLHGARKVVVFPSGVYLTPPYYAWAGGDALYVVQGDYIPNSPWGIARLSTESGQLTPLPAANRALRGRIADPALLQFSPDGRYVACLKGATAMWLTLDGARSTTFEAAKDARLLWLGKTGLLCVLVRRDDVAGDVYHLGVVRSVLSPRLLDIHSLPDIVAYGGMGPWSTEEGLVVDWDPARAWSRAVPAGFRPRGTLRVLDPRAQWQVRSAAPLLVPLGMDLWDMAVSPRGDRVAYTFARETVPPVEAFLNRIWSGFRVTPRTTFSLWTSRLDGTDLKRVAETTAPSNEIAPNGPWRLQWLPDGQSMSFVYGAAVYITH